MPRHLPDSGIESGKEGFTAVSKEYERGKISYDD